MPATSSAIRNISKGQRVPSGNPFSRRMWANAREAAAKPSSAKGSPKDKLLPDRVWSPVANRVAAMPGYGRGNAGVVIPNRVQSDRGDELIERAHALAPLIAGAAERIETDREVPEPVLAALHEARLFRMLLPRSCDGEEVEPATFFQ